MRTLCNDLQKVIPDTVRINRGKLSIEGISKKALEIGANKMIMVERWKGEPQKIILFNLSVNSTPFLTLHLTGVKTQKEIGCGKTALKGLIITVEKNASLSIKHLANRFSKFLCVPLREKTKMNSDVVSAHFSNFKINECKISFKTPPPVEEIGPILKVKI